MCITAMQHRDHFRRVRQLFQFKTLEEDTAAFDDPDNNDNRLGSPEYGVCTIASVCSQLRLSFIMLL